jgi:predicted DNA-binding transcriptional regulator AlpA
MAKIESLRNIPRLGLSRVEVAIALGVAPNTVDEMVKEGKLPRPRRWHTRKFWRIPELEAAMSEWPVDGEEEAEISSWRATA